MTAQRLQERDAAGAAQTRARIPALARGIRADVAPGDVAQDPRWEARVEHRVEEADARAQALIDARDQGGPEGCGGTRSARRAAWVEASIGVDDLVAGAGVRQPRDVGDAPSDLVGLVRRRRDIGMLLPRRQTEERADAAAARATVDGVVPDDLARDCVAGALQARATTGEHVRARRREVRVGAAVFALITRAVVPGGATDRDALGRRHLERVADDAHGGP